ncbi:probable UPF0187 protein sll1024 at N-terminal half [Coccomyxa sp. Obi]|nr:probable UPF0187 protein sll1024 at N-terminal half [Coccomyxa sp. Obi]
MTSWYSAKSRLPLYQAGAGEKKKKPTRPGGAGTIKLAILRDEESWIPWRNYWLCTLFAIHGRSFPVAPMVAYSCWVTLVTVIIKWNIDDWSKYSELLALQYPVQTIGLALFLLLNLRTQTAYNRWWDGAKAFGGVIHNIQNVHRIAQAWVRDSAMATKLITWTTVIAIALKHNLHYSRDMSEVADMLTIDEMRKMMASDNLPLFAISQASDLLVKISRTDSSVEYIMLEVDSCMNRMLGEMGACLRIRNIPMPWAYVVHLRAFLVLWLLILPLAFISTLHWYTIPLSILVGYELLGYEEIGVEIENPFGGDFSDLPLETMTAAMLSSAQHFLRRIKESKGPYEPAAMANEAEPSGHTQSAAQLRALNKSNGLKRSKSAVEEAHTLDLKKALKCMTQHHQEHCQHKLYDRLGGDALVQAAVDIYYRKLLSDDRVAQFFSGIPMEHFKAKQVKFLTYALGGEDKYSSKNPTVSHQQLHNEQGVRVTHFHIVMGHLQDTLRELGVAEALIDECKMALTPMEKAFACCIGHNPVRQDSAKMMSEAKPGADAKEQRDSCPF